MVTHQVWCLSERCPSTSPFPDSPRIFGLMPTTNETTPPGRSFPDHAKEMTDAARRRAQKTQSKRRRRAELTPSNKDLDKTQNTQSRRRRRAELSPEDKDQANAERRVKRRFDKDSPDQAKEQTDAARRRARQSIGEYELIWLLQQRLRVASKVVNRLGR